MQTTYPRTRRWTRVEYDRLIEKGMFQPGERLELLAGNLVVREPQGDPHTLAVELVNEALRTAFGPEWRVRVQLPIALDEESEPEPDVSVAPGRARDRREAKPSRLALVVEIAESSLALDREHKGGLYARARVPEYWIVNLAGRVLEVYRDPRPDASASYGWAYRSVQSLRAGEHVSPRAAPTARVPVADLLP
ncbi:MAG TPA: Uma2 family endonuclease [Methylomirabilota bacterium]|nr:Uma2 family endonuclease [Methylomirabilota bacterium]